MAERKSWEVEVRVNGEKALTIGQGDIDGWVGGVENIEDFADEVRAAGTHLLAFIGDGEPKPCFLCGEFDCDCLAPTPPDDEAQG